MLYKERRQWRIYSCFAREDDRREAVTKLYVRHLNARQHLL
jgi:hypothetical protein